MKRKKDLSEQLDEENIRFNDSDLERDFRLYSAEKSTAILRRGSIVMGVSFAAFAIILPFWDAPQGDVTAVLNAIAAFACVKAQLVTRNSRFTSDPFYAETRMFILASILILCMSAGQVGSVYFEKLACDDEEDSNRIFMFGFMFGFWPTLGALIHMEVNVIHYKKYRLLIVLTVVTSALRTLVMHPLPGDPYSYIILSYVVWPPLVLMVARHRELTTRTLFLVQQSLKADNAALTGKLEAAENALKYEAATKEEHKLVTAMLSKSQELKELEVPFEDLDFQQRIAAGAFGEVIKASYKGTIVAVKRLLRTRINHTALTMLAEEALLLRDLRHPNIVQFVGASWDSAANICIVLEFVERGSLHGVLKDTSIQLSWVDPLLKMITCVTSALAYIHKRPSPIIHRDLKPANILVTPTFGCKLTDFGASRRWTDAHTMTQIGTKSYMAPEVIRGVRYDTKVDVYALGLILWTMHTRRPPFEDRAAITVSVLNGERPVIPDDMPPCLARLTEDCWQDEAEARPHSEEILMRLRSVDEEDLQDVGVGGVGGEGGEGVGGREIGPSVSLPPPHQRRCVSSKSDAIGNSPSNSSFPSLTGLGVEGQLPARGSGGKVKGRRERGRGGSLPLLPGISTDKSGSSKET